LRRSSREAYAPERAKRYRSGTNRELNGGIRELFGRIREEAPGSRFYRVVREESRER